MKKKIILCIVTFFCLVNCAFAHQPRIVESEVNIIDDPEISRAYYGELTGHSHKFKIKSEKPFRLYYGLLLPDIKGIKKEICLKITGENFEEKYDGENFEWEKFYEKFGGDHYLKGPENHPEGIMVEAGEYEIEIFNYDNQGKYILAVGILEKFPFTEIIRTIKTLPIIKSGFFGEPKIYAYFNLMGLMVFGPVILILASLIIIIAILRKRKKRARH